MKYTKVLHVRIASFKEAMNESFNIILILNLPLTFLFFPGFLLCQVSQEVQR